MLFKELIGNLFFERIKLLIDGVDIQNISLIENQNNLINELTTETLKKTIIEGIKNNSDYKIFENLTVYYDNNKKFEMEMVLVLPNKNGIYLNIIPNKHDFNYNNKKIFNEIKNSNYSFDNPFIKINLMDMLIISIDKDFLVSSKERDFIQKNLFYFLSKGSKVYFEEGFEFKGNKNFLRILKNKFFRFNKNNNFLNKEFYNKKFNYNIINSDKLFKFSNFNYLFDYNLILNMRKNNILFPEELLIDFKKNNLNLITYLIE